MVAFLYINRFVMGGEQLGEENKGLQHLGPYDAFIAEMDKFSQGERATGYNWLSAKRIHFMSTNNPDNRSGQTLVVLELGERGKDATGVLLFSFDELHNPDRSLLIQALETLQPGRADHTHREPVDPIKENAILARVTDLEALIERGSLDRERLTRDHIFTLVTQNRNPYGITRADVEDWINNNSPEIP